MSDVNPHLTYQPESQAAFQLTPAKERGVILLLSSLQFINIVDFMMVMPLGPEFAKALDMSVSHLGTIAACYTAAAAISGFVASFFLDRFDRKKALTLTGFGLSLGTIAGGFATNLTGLMWSRVLAGIFGGLVSAISLAIIGDIIPAHRRGRALAAFMTSFSIASIFGVPIGLKLAYIGGWQTPFFAVGFLCSIAAAAVLLLLPPMSFHLAKSMPKKNPLRIFTDKKALFSYALTSLVMMSGFLLFPNIASYLQRNVNFPRDHMTYLYFAGGFASLIATRIAGPMVDKLGPTVVFFIGFCGFTSGAFLSFYFEQPLIVPYVTFAMIMFFGNFRNIAMQTISSLVPEAQDRASFMSMQSTVQHISCSLGAYGSSLIISESIHNKLVGMDTVVLLSTAISFCALGMCFQIQKLTKEHKNALQKPA